MGQKEEKGEEIRSLKMKRRLMKRLPASGNHLLAADVHANVHRHLNCMVKPQQKHLTCDLAYQTPNNTRQLPP